MPRDCLDVKRPSNSVNTVDKQLTLEAIIELRLSIYHFTHIHCAVPFSGSSKQLLVCYNKKTGGIRLFRYLVTMNTRSPCSHWTCLGGGSRWSCLNVFTMIVFEIVHGEHVWTCSPSTWPNRSTLNMSERVHIEHVWTCSRRSCLNKQHLVL